MKDEKLYIKKVSVNLKHEQKNENNWENKNNEESGNTKNCINNDVIENTDKNLEKANSEKNKIFEKIDENCKKINEKHANFNKIQKIFDKKPNFNEKPSVNDDKLNVDIKHADANENDWLILSQKAKTKIVLNWLIKLAKANQLTFEDAMEILDKIAKDN